MAARIRLSAHVLRVQPGSETTVDCVVTNTGRIVDQFHIGVLGDAARWSTVTTPIALMPNQESVAQVTFRPPREASTSAGHVAFGVQVTSSEDPTAVVVEEGTLEILPFSSVTADLVPTTSHGRGRVHHEVAIDNRGNERLVARLAAGDQAAALLFRFRPAEVAIPPGQAAFSRLVIWPRKRFWRGPARSHQFEVVVRSGRDEAPFILRGSVVQDALLPRWLPVAAAVAVMLLAALTTVWLGLLKPAVQSAARNALTQQLQEQAAASRDNQRQLQQVQQQQSTQGQQLQQLTQPASPTPTPGVSPLGDPTDGRLTGNATFTVPDKSTLSITDLVIENPNDDSGLLHLQRNGKDLLVLKLDNFRDLDYHFVTPITVRATEKLQVVCEAASGTTACGGSVYYTGFMKSPPPS